jgi:hypothetical protein
VARHFAGLPCGKAFSGLAEEQLLSATEATKPTGR